MSGSNQGNFRQFANLPSATADSDAQVGLGILPIAIGIIYQALLIRSLLIHRSLCVIPMRQLTIILLIFLGTNSYADDTGDKIKKQTRLLKREGVDTIIVHRYSQFTGRFSIPYNDNELLCDK
ncbi:MAG: hypothetical protein C0490_20680, partial [Marivirga sp.]|nr:hypothetical protein [Marivirga sp.]